MHVINVWRCDLVRRSAIRGRRRRRIQQSVFGGVLQSQDGRMDDVDLVAWHRSQLRRRLGYRPANMRRLADGAHRLRQLAQSCRKIWAVGVSRVKPSNCFRLHPTSVISDHSTIPVPDSLQAPRLISFYAFNFRHKSFALHDVKLAELSNNGFDWKKRMWHFFGGTGKSQNILWPLLHIFRGARPPTLRIYRCPLG